MFLCALAALNITAWAFSAMALRRQAGALQAEVFALRRRQLVLSALYVFGCAFRSVFLVYDIPRMCLLDLPLSSVLVGRSVATVAELAFAAQWALMLRASALATGNRYVHTLSQVLVRLIAIAEICSWTAVLTTANLGHVFENSLWGFCAALIVASLIAIAPRWPSHQRTMIATWIVGGLAYVTFMFVVDVPMYWARWIADEAMAREYLGLAQGVADASACKLVSFGWEHWRHEVAWMSLYFSGGVWVSISLTFTRGATRR
jgi:hypothetical protein